MMSQCLIFFVVNLFYPFSINWLEWICLLCSLDITILKINHGLFYLLVRNVGLIFETVSFQIMISWNHDFLHDINLPSLNNNEHGMLNTCCPVWAGFYTLNLWVLDQTCLYHISFCAQRRLLLNVLHNFDYFYLLAWIMTKTRKLTVAEINAACCTHMSLWVDTYSTVTFTYHSKLLILNSSFSTKTVTADKELNSKMLFSKKKNVNVNKIKNNIW